CFCEQRRGYQSNYQGAEHHLFRAQHCRQPEPMLLAVCYLHTPPWAGGLDDSAIRALQKQVAKVCGGPSLFSRRLCRIRFWGRRTPKSRPIFVGNKLMSVQASDFEGGM